MKNELNIFLSAVRYFTRIPISSRVEHSQNNLNETMRYFPLIGWIVGGVSGLIFYGVNLFFPISISIIISMGVSILLTGAFHEDGLADVCDGFGGGWNKEQVLTIMKDSRIGTYGTLSLILVLLLKYSLLMSMPINLIPFVLIVGHSLSRFMVTVSLLFIPYVQSNASKEKPLVNEISLKNIIVSAIFGICPMFLTKSSFIFYAIIPVFMAMFFLGIYFKKRIGGYTGDCLGAIQQVGEIIFYLFFVLIKV